MEAAFRKALNARKRKNEEQDDTIEGARERLEEDNFVAMFGYFHGRLDGQALCLRMIKDGKFEAKRAKTASAGEKLAAKSTNKINMLSVENWADILGGLSPNLVKEQLKCGNKAWLCRQGCWIAGLCPESAIMSRKIRVIRNFVKKRSDDTYGSRYKLVRFEADVEEEEVKVEHDFAVDPGCFYTKYEDDKFEKGKIVFRGTPEVSVEIPDSLIKAGEPIEIQKNYDEQEAFIPGEFSDTLVSRVFQKAGRELPKKWFQKKITDAFESLDVDSDAETTTPATSTSTGVPLTEANLAAHSEAVVLASPAGDGAAPAPVLP